MSHIALPCAPAMETHSVMRGQDNCGLDTSQAGAQAEPVSNRSGDHHVGKSLVSQSERPWQGQVERCLTLLRTMDPAPRGNGNYGSGALPESPIDAL